MMITSKIRCFSSLSQIFESRFQESKNNPVISINQWVSFVKICNYVKTVITFERDKSVILIAAIV